MLPESMQKREKASLGLKVLFLSSILFLAPLAGADETCGEFDNEGVWHPCDPSIEQTYKMPDISAGFLFDIDRLEVKPCLSVELLDKARIKTDLGVASGLVFVYLGFRWSSIIEISTGVWTGYYLSREEQTFSYGVGVTLTKF